MDFHPIDQKERREEIYIFKRIIAWLDKNEKPQYPTSRDDLSGGYKELKNLAMMQRMEYEDKSRQFLKEGKQMNVNDKQMPIEYHNLLRDFQDLRKEKDELYKQLVQKEKVLSDKLVHESELEKRIKELEKETHEQSMNFEGLLTLLDDSKNRIKELEDAYKWHYTSKKDYPTLDGEYQVIVESHNHPGVYITTVYNWDSDLESFADSCYPENVVAWAELLPQPDNLEDEINS